MTCPAATGACTLPADGMCLAPKTPTTLEYLQFLSVTSDGVSFTVQWPVFLSLPDQLVEVIFRAVDGTTYRRDYTARDVGYLVFTEGVTLGETYVIWARVYTATQVDVFQELSITTALPSLDFSVLGNSQYMGIL